MHRTPAERWLERRLTARRRQETSKRRRPASRAGGGHLVADDAPASGRRALVGELIEDVVVEVATAWRHRR